MMILPVIYLVTSSSRAEMFFVLWYLCMTSYRYIYCGSAELVLVTIKIMVGIPSKAVNQI